MKFWRDSGSKPLVKKLTGTKPAWSDWIIWEALADAICKCILKGLGMYGCKTMYNSKKMSNGMEKKQCFQVCSPFFD